MKLTVFLFLAYVAFVRSKYVSPRSTFLLTQPTSEENALEISIVHGINDIRVRGQLGLSLPSAVGNLTVCESEPDSSCYEWGDYARVEVRTGKTSNCMQVEWTSKFAREIEDCYDLTDGVHWYGGTTSYRTRWPINQNPMDEVAFVTKDWKSVQEHYWLLSNGVALIMDPDTPLFFSFDTKHPNKACFVARGESPFTKRDPLTMKYEWCTGENVKDTHEHVFQNFFDKPSGIPDEDMLVRPFWSTWAEYHADINQTTVLEYAKRVVSEGFEKSSHIEIDDNWEVCYGEETFHPLKFPDPKKMVEEIKAMNMRVTAWVHPFVNFECELFKEGMDKGYFVKDGKDKVGITSWWQGSNSGCIDSTNTEAVEWWANRLRKLQKETGIDSFKFDAGEMEWLPGSSKLAGDSKRWPNIYTTKYVDAVSQFGGLIETRTAHLNQVYHDKSLILFQDKATYLYFLQITYDENNSSKKEATTLIVL